MRSRQIPIGGKSIAARPRSSVQCRAILLNRRRPRPDTNSWLAFSIANPQPRTEGNAQLRRPSCPIPMADQNKIMIYGPKDDGTYVVVFRTAGGHSLAISVPRGVLQHGRLDPVYAGISTLKALRGRHRGFGRLLIVWTPVESMLHARRSMVERPGSEGPCGNRKGRARGTGRRCPRDRGGNDDS
jgi:hypothetical protein